MGARTMRKALTAAALAASIAGCGEPVVEDNVEFEPDNFQNAIAALPEGQRNGVFVRAIQDAGEECQHVESSEPAGEHQGFPVWNATCLGGGTWTIVIMNNGTAQVLNDAEAALAGRNQAADAARNEAAE